MRPFSAPFALAISITLGSCVAPLPVKSIADPEVRGTIKENGIPKADIEVWVDHDDYDACYRPKVKTVTDSKDHFSFAGKIRSWTWLGWASLYPFACRINHTSWGKKGIYHKVFIHTFEDEPVLL